MNKTLVLLLAACGAPDPGTPACDTLSAEVPTPRGELSGVWDEAAGRMVLFGGDEGTPVQCTSATDFSGQTWSFIAACGAFRELTGEGPSRRGRHVAALDADGRRMLVHGGRFRRGTTGAYTQLSDLWALDLATDTWTRLARAGGPEARSNHVGVVAGGKLVIHGGNTSTDGGRFVPLGDVWTWDLAEGAWEELSTTGGPSARLFHAAAASPDGGTLYVYGGGDEGAFLGPFFGDLWALDLASGMWTELHPGGEGAPPARIWASLTADPDGKGLLLFGGHDDQSLGNRNDVWRFKLAGGTWERIARGDQQTADALGFCDFPADFVDPDLAAPERREAMATARTADGRLVVAGGKTDCGLINDVWSWAPDTEAWTALSQATSGEICLRTSASCSSMCF